MGIFNKLKNSFGSKPKQLKVIKLNESMNFFSKELNNKEQDLLDNIHALKLTLPEIIDYLKQTLKTLKNAKVEEERAKGSQQAKDSFVQKAEKIIANLNEDNYTDETKISNMLNSILKITPRQALHMDFFFKQEMLKLGEVLKKLKSTLDEIDKLQNTGILKYKKSLEKLLKNTRELEDKIILNKKKIEKLENDKDEWNKEVKNKSEKLSLLEMDKMNETKKKFAEMKKQKADIQQKINSAFSPAERFLKKYLYTVETNPEQAEMQTSKINENEKTILKMYTTTPHIAFRQDKNLVIKSLLEKSLIHVRNDPDVFDAKRAEKVEILLNEINSLAKERKQMQELEKKITEIQNEIQNIWIPKQKHRKALEKEIDDLLTNVDAIDREIIDLQQDTELKQKKLPLLKEEISNILSTATGKQVEIE